MSEMKFLAMATLATTLFTAGYALAAGPYVTLVENGISRKVPAEQVSEEKLLAQGCVKNSDMQGNAVYICNKTHMPQGPVAASDKGHWSMGRSHGHRAQH